MGLVGTRTRDKNRYPPPRRTIARSRMNPRSRLTPGGLITDSATHQWRSSLYSGSGHWLDTKGSLNLNKPGGSNDGLFLAKGSQNYVRFPGGTAGDYISTPDAAALDITADMTVITRVTPTSVSGGEQAFMAKWTTSGSQRSYMFLMHAGVLEFHWSTTGASGGWGQLDSSAHGVSADEKVTFKVEFDADDGAGGHQATFYKRTLDTDSWTTINTPTGAGTVAMHVGTGKLEVGNFNAGAGSYAYTGDMEYVEVYDGIEGAASLVAKWDAADGGSNWTTQTGADDGLVWTYNYATTGRKLCPVDVDGWLLGVDDYFAGSAELAALTPPYTIAMVYRHRRSAALQELVRDRDPGAFGTKSGFGIELSSTNTLMSSNTSHEDTGGVAQNLNSATASPSAGSLTTEVWVMNAEDPVWYRNGSLLATTWADAAGTPPLSTVDGDNVLTVGAMPGGASRNLDGFVVGLAYFSRGLTAGEAAGLHSGRVAELI